MNTLAIKIDPLATDVACDNISLKVTLADGRELSVPLDWFPRLRKATSRQRDQWRLIGGGIGIHWSTIDEDISVESLLSIHSPMMLGPFITPFASRKNRNHKHIR